MPPRGFTLIELLTSVAVIGLLLGLVTVAYSSLRSNVSLGNSAEEIVDALRTAQSRAIAGQGGTDQCVHFTATVFSVYSGPCTAASKVDHTLPAGISKLSGPSDVTFQRLTGTTVAAADIVIGFIGGLQKTIHVDTVGKIFIQ